MSDLYRCARDSRCVNRENVQDNGETRTIGGAILTPAGLCVDCAGRVSRAIAELPADYVELNLLLGSSGRAVVADVVRFSAELQVPIRLSVQALQASICHEPQAWAEPVAERLGIDWDTRRAATSRPGVTLQRSARLLSSATGTLLGLPEQCYRHHSTGEWIERDGQAGALDLQHLHELTRFVVGRTRLVHRLPAPCPRCERMTLVRHNGCEHVTCEGCGVRWPESDYRRLTLVLAEDYREPAA